MLLVSNALKKNISVSPQVFILPPQTSMNPVLSCESFQFWWITFFW